MSDGDEAGPKQSTGSSTGGSAPANPEPRLAATLRRTFASLSQRNYRLWFIGQSASLVGTWMQVTAQGFLIFQLTHSPAYLGYVGFASGVPIWLFSLFGGVVSDRVSRRNMLLITQTAMMILAFILAALTFLGLVQPWQVVVLAFALGVANAFDAPARQAFVVELVAREDLGNAIALNSTMVNLGTAIGPALAGVTYALFGPGWCFTINGISFLAVIIALLMMRLQPQPRRARKSSTVVDLKEGLRYVVSHPIIRVLIATAAVSTIFGLSFATLFPAWSVTVLGGDSTTNGFLQSARGLGSLIGALTIASLGRFKFKGRVLTLGTFIFPLSLLIWAAVRWLPLSLLLMVAVGIGSMFVINMTNILLQSHVTDDLRGRVMSVFTLSFFGMMPVGALLAGALAEATTEPIAIALGALVVLAFAAFLWLRVPQIRRLE
jgi:MFS family permease